jgi:hypothetical protein
MFTNSVSACHSMKDSLETRPSVGVPQSALCTLCSILYINIKDPVLDRRANMMEDRDKKCDFARTIEQEGIMYAFCDGTFTSSLKTDPSLMTRRV